MKLIIDIDENSRERLFDIANDELDVPLGLENIMIMTIVNGTPIPDNATNGDVIKVMFPNMAFNIVNELVWTRIDGEFTRFSTEWWNAPYQKGIKDEIN